MVYNAMKLFMEINPQLFDDCSHDYNEHQNSADKREQARKDKWAKLQGQADKMKQKPRGGVTAAPDAAQDNARLLGDLKLGDESSMAQTATVSSANDMLEAHANMVPSDGTFQFAGIMSRS